VSRRICRKLGLIALRSSHAGFRKQGTRCTIRVAMLAADRGAIKIGFFVLCFVPDGLGKIDFDIPAILMSRGELGQLRLPDASGRQGRLPPVAVTGSEVRKWRVSVHGMHTAPKADFGRGKFPNKKSAGLFPTSACSFGRLCHGFLGLPARDGQQHLALTRKVLGPLLVRSGRGLFLCDAAAKRVQILSHP
jgi:hypothetical protein